jgi:(1->4)-alpha-D-glucan 1-alpha-D-glucosylmutase
LSLNATSTHDTKRSEDVSARINVISEMPALWERSLARWKEWNRDKKTSVRGVPAPSPNDEILLYQVLLGAWPLSENEFPEFRRRIRAYMIKAAREGKTHTDWFSPETEYEDALTAFADAILDGARSGLFRADFLRLQALIAPFGAIGSLAQVLVKLASPGVPDLYQGTTLWDFSLVDPDNRRPVDFEKRGRMLQELEALAGCDPAALVAELTAHWRDGRIKLYMIWKALTYRRTHLELFLKGDYQPVEVTGAQREHAIAFTRTHAGRQALIVAPRLLYSISRSRNPFRNSGMWQDTAVQLPGNSQPCWHNVFTAERLRGARLPLSAVLKRFPVALLSRATNQAFFRATG